MKLLDNAPPFKDKKAIKMIEKELGQKISRLFYSFEPKHISAASFGQVYRAVLFSGEKVVLKVLRPNIRPIVYTELVILKIAARLIDFLCILGTFRLYPFISDFAVYTKEELDYLQEARYIRKMSSSPIKNPREKIPKVYWEYTTGKVLTLEFLEGVWMNEILTAINSNDYEKLEKYKERGIHLPTVAENLLLNSLIQAFEKKYFHADPHAANICIMEDNIIGYVDFGIVGKMDKKFREMTLKYLQAFFQDEIDEAYSALLEVIQPPSNLDLTHFEREMKELMADWLEDVKDTEAPLSERSALRRMFREGMIMRKYNLYFPEVTSRFYRLLMISDVIILQLDPKIDVIEVTTRYLRKLMVKTWAQKIRQQNLLEVLVESAYVMVTLPRRADQILSRLEKILKGTGRAISNIKTVPAKLLGFFGKFSFAASTAGFVLKLTLDPDFAPEFWNRTWNLTELSLGLFVASIISIWMARYLIMRN